MTNNREIRVLKSHDLRADGEKRTIAGYAAVFNSNSEDLGGFIETIAPGAFDAVMGDDVRALVNHDESKVLARTKAGTLRLDLDETGLRYEFDVPNTTYGNDLLESVNRGDISQSSFGFSVDEDEWERGMNGAKARRTITKVSRLYDVSPVTYPAYPDTSVALRKLEQASNDNHTIAIEQDRLTRALRISELKMKVKR